MGEGNYEETTVQELLTVILSKTNRSGMSTQ